MLWIAANGAGTILRPHKTPSKSNTPLGKFQVCGALNHNTMTIVTTEPYPAQLSDKTNSNYHTNCLIEETYPFLDICNIYVLTLNCSVIQSKIMRHIKKEKQINCQEIKQTTEPNTEMTLMLELSDRDARITMTNVLKDLEEKISM